MATRIYTKTGDQGQTGLFGGQRVAKDDRRVEVYGTVDELNSALGWARSLGAPEPVEAVLEALQLLLFELGAELATPPSKTPRSSGITEEDVTTMEGWIDAAETQLPPLKSFILPGGSPVAAALHLARNVCRRAERACVTLRREQPETREITVKFLNRSSDLLFVYARYANQLAGQSDVPWTAR